MEKKEKQVEQISIYEVLTLVQNELKAPKNQRNNFGKYNYRSCEDIMEALKPILLRHNAGCKLSDKIVSIGVPEVVLNEDGVILKENGRVYVEATCTFTYGAEYIESTASAREEYSKKGMDSMQLTGATSSYARKYALNSMFLIDDTKDADATNTHGTKTEQPKKPVIEVPKITVLTNENINQAIKDGIQEKVLKLVGTKYSITEEQKQNLIDSINL
jgi:hypothetical protein